MVPFRNASMIITGTIGAPITFSTEYKLRLRTMLWGHSHLHEDTLDIFLETETGKFIRVLYNGEIIRQWNWNSDFVDCFFEDRDSIPLSKESRDYLANNMDQGFYYAPYIPIFHTKKLPLIHRMWNEFKRIFQQIGIIRKD